MQHNRFLKLTSPAKEGGPAISRRCWDSRAVWSLFGILFAGFVITQLIFRNTAAAEWEAGRQILLSAALFHGSGLAFILFKLYSGEESWRNSFNMTRRTLETGLKEGTRFYLAGIPLIWIAALLYGLLLRLFGEESGMQEVVRAFLNDNRPALQAGLIFLSIIIAPLFEELFFRGILFPFFLKTSGAAVAAITVSVLFVLMHPPILSTCVPIYLLSTLLCFSYWKTGTLWTPIIIHALFNGINLLILLNLAV